MSEFCYHCGKQKKEIPCGTFNQMTGEENIRYECVDDCAHGNHTNAGPPSITGMFFGYRCDRCGKRYHIGE